MFKDVGERGERMRSRRTGVLVDVTNRVLDLSGGSHELRHHQRNPGMVGQDSASLFAKVLRPREVAEEVRIEGPPRTVKFKIKKKPPAPSVVPVAPMP